VSINGVISEEPPAPGIVFGIRKGCQVLWRGRGRRGPLFASKLDIVQKPCGQKKKRDKEIGRLETWKSSFRNG